MPHVHRKVRVLAAFDALKEIVVLAFWPQGLFARGGISPAVALLRAVRALRGIPRALEIRLRDQRPGAWLARSVASAQSRRAGTPCSSSWKAMSPEFLRPGSRLSSCGSAAAI